MPFMNRRTFGQTAAAAAGVTLAPFVHTKRARAQDMVDVIIIGAGLSGLNAATILSESGLTVLVLEGSNRIGGRVWSAEESWETNAGEVPIELGASQVGPSYARVRDAILRYDLPMVNEDRSLLPFSFHIGGQHVKAEDWPDAPVNKTVGDEREVPPTAFGSSYLSKFNPLVELDDWLSPKFSEYDVSISELFRRNGVSEAGIRLAGASTEMNAVSALRMLQEQTRGKLAAEFAGPLGDDGKPIEHWPKNFVGGTIALPLAMAGALPSEVRLNQQVVAIDMDNDGADVRTLDGGRYRSKFVISSLPFTVLRHVDIWPRPDAVHIDAIQNLDYFETTRAFCLIKEPFWQEDGFEPGLFTDGPLRMLWVIDNHKGEGTYRGMFVLTGITGYQVASQSPEAAKAFLIREMERLRPASKGQIEILRYHSWGNQPFQKGCSPMFAPGQVMSFANDMIIPHGRLHFCGEHTRRLDFGMEAAMESGERAAFEVLDRT